MSGNLDAQVLREGSMTLVGSSQRAVSSPGTAVTPRKAASVKAAWDPYEVWLTRIKQPRDRVEQELHRHHD